MCMYVCMYILNIYVFLYTYVFVYLFIYLESMYVYILYLLIYFKYLTWKSDTFEENVCTKCVLHIQRCDKKGKEIGKTEAGWEMFRM